MIRSLIKFFLEQKLLVAMLLLVFTGWGIATAPFDWERGFLPSDPVPVDALPDLGENQQIVFTEWKGRSPQDVEDQVTYPLTTALLGIPGVKTVRSNSMFGFSSIYLIFDENIDFYWSRSRILEKLNSLSPGLLPEDARPGLGPDATALGQIFWYTLEGRDKEGKPTGGWDLQEIRSVQDFNLKYALSSVEGVSEVASVGGFVKEYQVDLDPVALKARRVSLEEVVNAVRGANQEVGARTVEINRAEYLVRGLGYVEAISDLEEAVVKVVENIPIRVKDVARVHLGPANRRGVLDKGGAEVVGGVVVARYGANPLQVIQQVQEKIREISHGLPQKKLRDGRTSQLTVVPFYDRSELIQETLGTLEESLSLEIMVTLIVILLMVLNLRASLLISTLLPLAVLMCFIGMRYAGVDANIVALSGIAIAIGTIVDMGIVMSENMISQLREAPKERPVAETILEAAAEVAPAILTATLTTIISFVPVFALQEAEGKLFRPLAFTKTFALVAALILTLTILPALAQWIFSWKMPGGWLRRSLNAVALVAGIILLFFSPWAGILLVATGLAGFADSEGKSFPSLKKILPWIGPVLYSLAISWMLGRYWLPLGPDQSLFVNFIFVGLLIGLLIAAFHTFIYIYPRLLSWVLRNKLVFMGLPLILILWGGLAWIGVPKLTGKTQAELKDRALLGKMAEVFPGIGEEFMPALDEGSFLLMPSSMPHSGMEENIDLLKKLDMAVQQIPEVEQVVGKLGRVESAIDPAPVSMFENMISYKSEYRRDESGRRIRFRQNEAGEFVRDAQGELIEDEHGAYFRQWRDHIRSPDDIWQEISAIQLPGLTSAPKLQPIETRLVMLQTGMRAPMGIKVKGPSLDSIQQFAFGLEQILLEVPGVRKEAVFADRIVGKPYLEIKPDRLEMARYGLSMARVQAAIHTAIGGMGVGTTVEGRERYTIRVRYAREFRETPSAMNEILVSAPDGTQIPLGQIASINYRQGPQMIKSEDTFLVGYVLFDKTEGFSEVEVVEAAQSRIANAIKLGKISVPAGVSYGFSGNYQQQVRAEKRLSFLLPLVLLIILLVLYFQFRSLSTSVMIFTGIALAFSGGFIMIWLYAQPGFLDFSLFGQNFRDLFQVETLNLSVAVWVGFIALFGIATDDGVVMATYLKQEFDRKPPGTIAEIRKGVIEAGSRRIRPCLMTTATTLLALLPILTSTGRGSDIMVPMAIPSFGGMALELITLFIIPVLWAWREEMRLKKKGELK